MRTALVKVLNIVQQNAPEMRLVPDQKPIQAFFAYRAHPAFRKGIRVRGVGWRANNRDPLGLENDVEGEGEFGVSVVDQKTHRQLAITY